MKRLFIILLLIVFPAQAFGAGTFTVTKDSGTSMKAPSGDPIRVITLTAVADSSDGSIPQLTLNNATSGVTSTLAGWSISSVLVDGDHAVTHDGSADAAALSDTDAGFDDNQWVDYTITNSTDSSSGTVTANTRSTVTATLSGGTDNDWDVGDAGVVGTEPTNNSEIYIYQNGIDLLGGNGVNKVDNDSENIIHCKPDQVNYEVTPITDDIVVTITQQATATNDAVIFVKIILE